MAHWYKYGEDLRESTRTLSGQQGRSNSTGRDELFLNGPFHWQGSNYKCASTWWGEEWFRALGYGSDARLRRGRSYARDGSVLEIAISPGSAQALVRGSHSPLYTSTVHLETLDNRQWEVVFEILNTKPALYAKLLAGELSPDLYALCKEGGVALLPDDVGDLGFSCSCADWGYPCKHAAALHFVLAEQLDLDPFILFRLRGRTRDQVIETIGRMDSPTDSGESRHSGQPLSLDTNDFWTGRVPIKGFASAPLTLADDSHINASPDAPGFVARDLAEIYRMVATTVRSQIDSQSQITLDHPDDPDPTYEAQDDA